MEILKFIKHYLYRRYLLGYILLSVLAWIISIYFPYIIGKYIDAITTTKNYFSIYYYTKVLVIICICAVLFSYLKNIILIKLRNKTSFKLNSSVIEHVKRLPLSYFNNIDSAYLNQRISSDSNIITSFVVDNIVNFVINIFTIVILIYLLWSINSTISFYLCIIIPIVGCIYHMLKKFMYRMNYELKERQSTFYSRMQEQFSNIKVIKINGWLDITSRQLIVSFNTMFYSAIKYAKIAYIFQSTDNILNYICYIILFFYGGIEIIKNNLSIGQFTIIINYFSILRPAISFFIDFTKNYQETLTSYNRIQELLSIEKESNGISKIDNINKIELVNVSFSYDSNKSIINKLNYSFVRGKIYGIIGENGAGKTTLINIIIGLIRSYDGNVLYNDINIKKLDMYYLRQNLLGVSEQEPYLINDTILNNLVFGSENKKMRISPEYVKK